jgi:hypothetical protein
LLVSCADQSEAVRSIDALVSAGDFGAALGALETDIARDDSGLNDFRERRLYVLAHAGLGNCEPALDLLSRGGLGFSDQVLQRLAGQAADLAASDAVAVAAGLSGLGPFPSAGEAALLADRLDGSVQVLSAAKQLFPQVAPELRERTILLNAAAKKLSKYSRIDGGTAGWQSRYFSLPGYTQCTSP